MKKKTEKKTVRPAGKKFDMQRAKDIADVLGVLSQFIPRIDEGNGISPLFSRQFLLKNLLGLSDEEFKLNEQLIQSESELILSTLAMLKEQTPEGVIDLAKVKKGKAN